MKKYINTMYGTCDLMEKEGRCLCLKNGLSVETQKFCKKFTSVDSTDWNSMIELAKKRYQEEKND